MSHVCKNITSMPCRFNRTIMFKSFPRSRESNKVHSLVLVGGWGSLWRWRLQFNSLWCWFGVEGNRKLLHCPWPDPSTGNDSQRPNIQLSLQMWPRDKKKKVIFSNPLNSWMLLKESNVQLSGTLLQPFLAPIKLPMSGWIRAYCKFMVEKNLRIRSRRNQKSSFEIG